MITITNLSSKKNNKNYIFADLKLDLEEKKISNNIKNNDVVNGFDLSIDTDIEAIKNSIRNILTQTRYLTPGMNINLRKYIGSPVSEMGAIAIGEDIERAIFLFEQRIKVDKIIVRYNIEQMTYFIDLRIRLLNFSESVQILNAALTINGEFSFINK